MFILDRGAYKDDFQIGLEVDKGCLLEQGAKKWRIW